MRLAYLVSRFPKTTETFITNEIMELMRQGHEVLIHSLVTEIDQVVHPGVERLVGGVRSGDSHRLATLVSTVGWLLRRPLRSARLIGLVVRCHVRQPREMVKYLWQFAVACRWSSELREADVDHVHAHWATYPAFGAMVIGELIGIPFSFTGHAHDIQLPNPTLPAKARAAQFIVTISEFNRRLIQGLVPDLDPTKINVVHCGVDVDAVEASGPHVPSAEHVVVCVGGLVPYKGQSVLIDACAKLAERGVNVRCRLIGEGPDREALSTQIDALGLGGIVELVGRLPADQVMAELRAAEMMVLASVVLDSGQAEGIPVALMEAMAVGVPVVSTSTSGIPELVIDGETGLLVAPGDSVALADAMQAVIGDAVAARERATAGRALVRSRFDLHTEVGHLAELFSRSSPRVSEASPTATS